MIQRKNSEIQGPVGRDRGVRRWFFPSEGYLIGAVHAAVFHPLECLSVDFGLAMAVPGHALLLRNGWSPRRL